MNNLLIGDGPFVEAVIETRKAGAVVSVIRDVGNEVPTVNCSFGFLEAPCAQLLEAEDLRQVADLFNKIADNLDKHKS